MTAQDFFNYIERFTQQEYNRWFKVQVLRAVDRIGWLGRKVGRAIHLDPADIVHDTIARILAGVEDDTRHDDGSLDSSFKLSIHRTIDAQWSKQRAEKRRFDRPDYVQICAENLEHIHAHAAQRDIAKGTDRQDECLSAVLYQNSLKVMIASSPLRGAAKAYGEQLADFVYRRWSQEEVASNLKVSKESLPQYRNRLLKYFKPPEK